MRAELITPEPPPPNTVTVTMTEEEAKLLSNLLFGLYNGVWENNETPRFYISDARKFEATEEACYQFRRAVMDVL